MSIKNGTERPLPFVDSTKMTETQPVSSLNPGLSTQSDTQPLSSSPKHIKNKSMPDSLIRVYHCHRISPVEWFLLIVFAILSSTLILLVTIWQYWLYGRYYGFFASDQWNRVWIYMAGIWILILIGFVFLQWKKQLPYIYLYQNEIRYRTGVFKKGTILKNQISGIIADHTQEQFLGIQWRNYHKVTIINNNGEKIKFDHRYKQISDFTFRLKNLIYPLLIPPLQEKFFFGETLKFGPVQVSKSKIKVSRKEISWKDVVGIRLESGQLYISYNKEPSNQPKDINIPANKIPNLEILIQLMQTGLKL
jgi:hypothetical protein